MLWDWEDAPKPSAVERSGSLPVPWRAAEGYWREGKAGWACEADEAILGSVYRRFGSYSTENGGIIKIISCVARLFIFNLYYMGQGGVDSRFPFDVLLIELVPEEEIRSDSLK